MIDLVRSSFERAGNVTWRSFEETSVLLNLESGDYFTLNAVGTLVWEMLDRRMAGTEILARLRDRYEVAEAEAHRDLVELFGQLAQEGLIVVYEDA